ncbi:MAG: hypothetical protein WD768_04050 [Phycisphaeraceae bacterium]
MVGPDAVAACVVGFMIGSFVTANKNAGGPFIYGIMAFVFTQALPLLFIAVHRRYVTTQAIAAVAIEVSGLWIGVGSGFLVTTDRSLDFGIGKAWEIAAGNASLAILAIALILTLMHWWRHPKLGVGPYCPDCEYHLVGVKDHLCPECGRPFALDELRITESDLRPPDAN